MKRKTWSFTFILFATVVFLIVFLNKDDSVYSKENCLESTISCVNAFTNKDMVKVFNGTTVIDLGEGNFGYGDVLKGDLQREKLDVLVAEKNEVVTLEFINNKPLSINVYQLDGEERAKEITMTQDTFTAPNTPGTYKYELFGEYSNGTVHHYVKIKVK